MSYSKAVRRTKAMAVGHCRRHRKKRDCRGCGNTEDRLFDFDHGSLLTRGMVRISLHNMLISNATQPYRSIRAPQNNDDDVLIHVILITRETELLADDVA